MPKLGYGTRLVEGQAAYDDVLVALAPGFAASPGDPSWALVWD